MGLVLKAKESSTFGNAIIYGGENSLSLMASEKYKGETEVFFVETDFGHHLRLTWPEIEENFKIIRWSSYDGWRHDRALAQEATRLDHRDDIHFTNMSAFTGG